MNDFQCCRALLRLPPFPFVRLQLACLNRPPPSPPASTTPSPSQQNNRLSPHQSQSSCRECHATFSSAKVRHLLRRLACSTIQELARKLHDCSLSCTHLPEIDPEYQRHDCKLLQTLWCRYQSVKNARSRQRVHTNDGKSVRQLRLQCTGSCCALPAFSAKLAMSNMRHTAQPSEETAAVQKNLCPPCSYCSRWWMPRHADSLKVLKTALICYIDKGFVM